VLTWAASWSISTFLGVAYWWHRSKVAKMIHLKLMSNLMVPGVKDRAELKDLTQWHLPDGTLSVSSSVHHFAWETPVSGEISRSCYWVRDEFRSGFDWISVLNSKIKIKLWSKNKIRYSTNEMVNPDVHWYISQTQNVYTQGCKLFQRCYLYVHYFFGLNSTAHWQYGANEFVKQLPDYVIMHYKVVAFCTVHYHV
jgi:hypothetical protein